MNTERDPRIDPRPGDVLEVDGYPERHIRDIYSNGRGDIWVVYTIEKQSEIGPFFRWAKQARIVRRAEGA